MYEVTVEDSFAAGHYLRNYRGKCENPHGHNYKVQITLQGRELDHAGLLLDFKELKLVMKPVIDRLDHRMINDVVSLKFRKPLQLKTTFHGLAMGCHGRFTASRYIHPQ